MATAAPEVPVLARDQAFESLYRQYVKDVYHYALALLRNPADAEDVTQTTFLNAYRAYIKGVEVEKPQNWLIKIAHNVARTRYARASRRVKEVPLEEHVELIAAQEDDRPDVQGVLDALGRLPFNQRSALVMRELEGRTYAEIADTIGVSVSAVETLIFRARRSLRLKASALRTLAVVPLPTSLAQFFDTGGVVAGGDRAGPSGPSACEPMKKSDKRSAARLAVWLAWDCFAFRGETAVANGWLQRARRLLDGLPPSPELAWLESRESQLALAEDGDPDRAHRHATEAIRVGRAAGSIDYEMLGRSLQGLALVASGISTPLACHWKLSRS
jgi:RNA polymerase sigma factor (sigma-70 family)